MTLRITDVRIYCGSVSRLTGEEPDLEGTYIIKGEAESLEQVKALIEAAPDLLLVCKEIDAAIFSANPFMFNQQKLGLAMALLKTVVAKAEGTNE